MPYSGTKRRCDLSHQVSCQGRSGLGDITVSSIAPILDTIPQETIDYMVSRIPMGRTGKLASVAHVVRYRHTSEALSLPIFGKKTIVAEGRQSIATAEAAHRAPETQRLSLRLLILATGIRYNYLGTTIRHHRVIRGPVRTDDVCDHFLRGIVVTVFIQQRLVYLPDALRFPLFWRVSYSLRLAFDDCLGTRGGGPHTSTIQQK